MDRGAWQATVHGVAESNTTEQLTHPLFLQPTKVLLQELWDPGVRL